MDAKQRVTATAAVPGGVVLDAAANVIEASQAQLDDVEGSSTRAKTLLMVTIRLARS